MGFLYQLETVISPSWIGYGLPLPILVSIWISIGRWLTARNSGLIIYLLAYGLSVWTYALVKATPLPPIQAAILGGIIAPTVYGLLGMGLGIVSLLRTPYGHYRRPHRVSLKFRQRWQDSLIGVCAGGIAGAAIGLSLCYLIILLLFSFTFIASDQLQDKEHFKMIDRAILGCSFLGAGLGLSTGLGYVNQRRLSEKLLISLVIQSSFIIAACKKILRALSK